MEVMRRDSLTVITMNAHDAFLKHKPHCSATNRKFSLSSLRLPNGRVRLLGTMGTANGPVMIIFVSNGPLIVA